MIPRQLPDSSVNRIPCPVRQLSEKSRAVLDAHILYHGMPGCVVERSDYAALRVHVIISCLLRTRPCSVQPSRKPQNNTRYNVSYEGCEVMLRCLPRCEGTPLGNDRYTSPRKKKMGGLVFSGPSGGRGVVRCTLSKSPGTPVCDNIIIIYTDNNLR